MKPSIPETGKVIKVEKDMALVMLTAGNSCKGCGAAEIGLCKTFGNVSMLSVKNMLNAEVGDTVKIGLDKSTQRRGFLLAYIIPVVSFICGSIPGYAIGRKFSIPSFEVFTGFISLMFSLLYSLTKLKKLDKSSLLTIEKVVSDNNS